MLKIAMQMSELFVFFFLCEWVLGMGMHGCLVERGDG